MIHFWILGLIMPILLSCDRSYFVCRHCILFGSIFVIIVIMVFMSYCSFVTVYIYDCHFIHVIESLILIHMYLFNFVADISWVCILILMYHDSFLILIASLISFIRLLLLLAFQVILSITHLLIIFLDLIWFYSDKLCFYPWKAFTYLFCRYLGFSSNLILLINLCSEIVCI